MKYTVEITETLQRRVSIEAKTAEEAAQKIKEQYRNEDIILDSLDFVDVKIDTIKDE